MPSQRGGSKEAPWAECLMMLENREIDLAMLPIKLVPPRFEARRLYHEDFVVAMRKGHPFARAPTEAAFCAAEHLLVSSTEILMASWTRCWQSAEVGAVSS
ncbi:MAG: LysR substrate-binding domain-containing protein [Bradyrhizobium sp.]